MTQQSESTTSSPLSSLSGARSEPSFARPVGPPPLAEPRPLGERRG
ncbi:hypothetical protein [Streptomyces scabiei]|nr:hypothetical protein [Streptomyces scabiei]